MGKDKKQAEKKQPEKKLKNQNVGEGTYDPGKTYVVQDGCAVETVSKGTVSAGRVVKAAYMRNGDAKMKELVEKSGVLVEKKDEPKKDGE
jgi:hypothetical protein